MRKKCALIVDDSRTAREILARRLAAYDIDIVKVDSAANAIDYLYKNTPDAVFMDYEMPGMDGFQALRVIKSNPNTATIPVMMYTSKAGGLALGEARALGAIGVLPKQMQAQDLDAVIQQLHLLPEQISLVEAFHQGGEQHGAGLDMSFQHQPNARVEYLDAANVKQETVEYPGEVYDESLFLLKRQTRMFQKDLLAMEQRMKDALSQESEKLIEELFSTALRYQALATPIKWKSRLSLFSTLLLMFGVFMIGWKMNALDPVGPVTALGHDMRSELSELKDTLDYLEQVVEYDRVVSSHDTAGAENAPHTSTRTPHAMDILRWAANRGTEFGYGENPYDDMRVVWLSELVQQLRNAGFDGVVNLQAHYGEFCLSRSQTGSLRLAGENMPFNECLFTGQSELDGFSQNSYQTIGFANFVNSLTADEGGAIDVFVERDVRDAPLVPYPERYSVQTAGEWNRIAAQNQRIRVSLYRKSD